MKKTFLVILFLSMCGCQTVHKVVAAMREPPKDDVLTILVAGQSNALSLLRGSGLRQYSTTGMVEMKEAPVTPFLVPTQTRQIDQMIAWIYCGDLLAQSLNKKIRFVNFAVNGASSKVYNENGFRTNLGVGAEELNADLVVWIQGEADYSQGLTEEESYSNLKYIINYVKGHKNIPFYVALNSNGDALDAYADRSQIPVRKAQMRLIAEGLARQGPDTDKLRDLFPTDPGRLHFIGEGIAEHGLWWARIIARDFN